MQLQLDSVRSGYGRLEVLHALSLQVVGGREGNLALQRQVATGIDLPRRHLDATHADHVRHLVFCGHRR